MTLHLSTGTLSSHDRPVLTGLAATVSTIADPNNVGVFLRFKTEKPSDRLVLDAGRLTGVRRFTSLRRYEPFWMIPEAGTRGGQVPVETQFLLVEIDDNTVAAIVPLIDGAFRASLQGKGDDGLELVVESADLSVVTDETTGLFIAVGGDPYELIPQVAQSVNAFMNVGRLRKDKPLPPFIDHFGWCTWDAFYQDVSHDKVQLGLQSFRDGGVEPKLLILDDGWQSVRKMPSGSTALTAFAANEKFGGTLKPTVQMAKGDFGIETFLVWHAMMGYWGGVDAEALPGYGVRSVARQSSPGIRHYEKGVDSWWGPTVGLVPPEQAYRFFQDYHRHLRSEGVDGVKVDTQAALETIAQGSGGRVALMQCYHEALEGSTNVHFAGNLINCMSCAAEMLYGAPASTITRTSTDFWPKKPESHGLHLYINAQVSAWFGEFVFPDWDMFQSGHAMGAYHAAGRAVSGSTVYVSDKPDEHNFELLKKMVLHDGSILRCRDIGRPTRDCLFTDPTKQDVLLKIFNRNALGGVIGVFNARYSGATPSSRTIDGAVRPDDVHGLPGDHFALYAHQSGTLTTLPRTGAMPVALPELSWEIVTMMPIDHGFAPIGLANMLNSGGAVAASHRAPNGDHHVTLRGGGRFVAYSQTKPERVTLNGANTTFSYDQATGCLTITIPTGAPAQLVIATGQA